MDVVGKGFVPENFVLSDSLNEGARLELSRLRQAIDNLVSAIPGVGSKAGISNRLKVAALLAARLIEASSGIFLVASHGMNNETRSLFRVFLDAYFLFACVAKESAFHEEYFRSDEANRLKLVKVLLTQADEVFAEAREYAVNEKAALQQRVWDDEIRCFKAEELAKRAGCDFHYQTMYRSACASDHSSPRSLECYAVVDGDGEVVSIDLEVKPVDDDSISAVVGMLEIVTSAVSEMS